MSAAAEKYEVTIGLEIHVQLATQTKMFCGCRTSFGDDPNTTPARAAWASGLAPAAERQGRALRLMMGLALGSDIAPRSIFHRKNYFYPTCRRGTRSASSTNRSATAANSGRAPQPRAPRGGCGEAQPRRRHGRISGSEASVVDFNRGGTPLAEIVTEPDLHSAEQASEWPAPPARHDPTARRQRREHGGGVAALRRQHLHPPEGPEGARHQTELKNMNSFRFIERGIKPRWPGRSRSSRAAARWWGRPFISTRAPRRSPRCAARKRRTTTATSRARPRPRDHHARHDRGRQGRTARAAAPA